MTLQILLSRSTRLLQIAKPGIVLLLLIPAFAVGQQGDRERLIQIKTSGEYYWAEAFSADVHEARTVARQNLIERISVHVTSDSELQIRDDDQEYSSRMEMRTRTLSSMRLRGSDYIAERRADDTWRVTAFISEDDFEKSMETESGRLLSKIREAHRAEQAGNVNTAMTLWMEVLGATAFFPLPVYGNTDEHGTDAEIGQHARSKITEWLQKADVRVHQTQNRTSGDNVEIYLDIDISFAGRAATGVSAGIARPGFGQHSATQGRARLFLDRARDSSAETLVISLKPVPPEGIAPEYAEVLRRIRPSVQQSVDVGWSGVVSVSFEAVEAGSSGFRLIPETQNLSVFDLQWRLPGSRSTSDSAPVIRFDDGQEYADIQFQINRDDGLTVSKRLLADGSLTAVPPADTPSPETSPAAAPEGVLQDLFRIRSSGRFTQHLLELQEEGIITLARRRAEMTNPQASYMAIINPNTRLVEAILSPAENEVRTRIPGSQTLREDEISSRFENMGAVWFRFTP